MSKLFTSVPVPKFPSNTFNLSREVLGSADFHRLYPTNVHEVLPGDGFVESSECFVRLEPLVAPAMTKMDVDFHAFFVPRWQLNNHFDDFITGGEKGDYADHMPFGYIDNFYDLVHDLLSYNLLPSEILETEEPSQTMLDDCLTEAQWRLDLAVRILTQCDFLRAVPFVKPDLFEITPDVLSLANIKSIMDDNVQIFEDLNKSKLENRHFRVNLDPFYAYAKTYCEFFRDENLKVDFWQKCKDEFDILSGLDDHISVYGDLEGLISDFDASFFCPWINLANYSHTDFSTTYYLFELFAVQYRAWKKDRYTSALPWTQKGDDVLIPVNITGTVSGGIPYINYNPGSGNEVNLILSGTGAPVSRGNIGVRETDPPYTFRHIQAGNGSIINAENSTTIRDLRRAFAAESFKESDGLFGNRYPENTLGQFGVFTPDSRLPRSQFLGSRTQRIVVSEVVQNSATNATSPQGNLAGKGTSYGSGRIFRGRFTQHGFIVVFTSFRVRALYEGGINPMFSRFDRTEYAWPRFARLGEQPIYTKELFIGPLVGEQTIFGYGPRYLEYKSDVSSVHGSLKSTRNFWTFSRRFEETPKLNEEFIYNAPRKDAFAVTSKYVDPFTFEIDYRVKSNRKLPFWGTPAI